LPPPAIAPIDRQLALALLIDEVRGERSHRGGVVLPVGTFELALGGVAAAGGRAHDVMRQKASERASIDHRRGRGERGRRERHQQHEADPLDARLTVFTLRTPAGQGVGGGPKSRTRSTGLRQSFAIRTSSETGIVWCGKRISGCRTL
jgi:hypothetical protein